MQSAASLHSAEGPVALYSAYGKYVYHTRTYDGRVIKKREGIASRIREIDVSIGIENGY